MINNKRYGLTIYSFIGDSVEDQLEARAQLSYYVEKIVKYTEFGAGSLCISLLNNAEPIVTKT